MDDSSYIPRYCISQLQCKLCQFRLQDGDLVVACASSHLPLFGGPLTRRVARFQPRTRTYLPSSFSVLIVHSTTIKSTTSSFTCAVGCARSIVARLASTVVASISDWIPSSPVSSPPPAIASHRLRAKTVAGLTASCVSFCPGYPASSRSSCRPWWASP